MDEEDTPICTDNSDLTYEEHQILFREMGGCPYCGFTSQAKPCRFCGKPTEKDDDFCSSHCAASYASEHELPYLDYDVGGADADY